MRWHLQITSLTIVYSTVYSGADQRKHQSPASLAFVRGIRRWPVNSPHKWPVNAVNVSIWWRHHDNLQQPHPFSKMWLPFTPSIPLLTTIICPQLIKKMWPDVHRRLRVDHYFLAFFVSAGIVDITYVDYIMEVNGPFGILHFRQPCPEHNNVREQQ